MVIFATLEALSQEEERRVATVSCIYRIFFIQFFVFRFPKCSYSLSLVYYVESPEL